MANTNDPRVLAGKLASELLAKIGFDGAAGQAVRLTRLRNLLYVNRPKRDAHLSEREGALVSKPTRFLWDADLMLGPSSSKSRFTYAHELGHQAANLFVSEEILTSWAPDNVRRFCDEFASQLLVPDNLLTESLRLETCHAGTHVELTVEKVEKLYRRLRVPMAVVVKRLSDITLTQRIRLMNCVIVVCANRSAKQKTHFAPRILTSCVPLAWFLPANKRLVSLGLKNLDRAFWENQILNEGLAVDNLTVWVRAGWRRESVERSIDYRIYPGEKGINSNRVMIAVFPGPDNET